MSVLHLVRDLAGADSLPVHVLLGIEVGVRRIEAALREDAGGAGGRDELDGPAQVLLGLLALARMWRALQAALPSPPATAPVAPPRIRDLLR